MVEKSQRQARERMGRVTWAKLGNWTFTLQLWELVRGFKQRHYPVRFVFSNVHCGGCVESRVRRVGLEAERGL